MSRFCALNIGNTHTQIAMGILKNSAVKWEKSETFATSAIPFTELPIDILTVYSSVVPQITAIMKAKFPQAVPCTAANVKSVDFSSAPPTLGMDRIANCAALVQKNPGGIVIDAGTCITLEVVANRKFIGGAILPGTGILARAMHDYTGALPLVDCGITPDLQQFKTETLTAEAMKIGIQSAAVAGTLQLLSNFIKKLPPASPVFVCGGYRQSLLNQNCTVPLLDGGNDFTMQGLAALAAMHMK